MENKTKGNESKIIIGNFNCTLKIYGGGRAQISLGSPITTGPLAQDPGLTGFIMIKKIANNTKINHKMISFSDHYNALFIDRFSFKTKIGKDMAF